MDDYGVLSGGYAPPLRRIGQALSPEQLRIVQEGTHLADLYRRAEARVAHIPELPPRREVDRGLEAQFTIE